MGIAAGRLRDRVTIIRPTNVDEPDAPGAYRRGWAIVERDVPAEVVSQAGREVVMNAALQGIAAYRITMRLRCDVHETDVMVFGDRELRITAPPVVDRLARSIVIFADTGSPQLLQR